MKQVKLTQSENDYRSLSTLIALSGISGASRFHFMEKIVPFYLNIPIEVENFRLRTWIMKSS